MYYRLVSVFCGVFLLALGGCVEQEMAAAPEGAQSLPAGGYNCLFMGHSFFSPIARNLPMHAENAGIVSHRQVVVAHGGQGGSPGNLWNSPQEDVARAKEWIATGEVDLIGLTFYPFVASEVEDYRRWVDLALSHNPDTIFVIQAPWAIKGKNGFEQYRFAADQMQAMVHERIAKLRELYPDSRFLCLPQGRWMVELWHLYEAGELGEITKFVAPRHNQSQDSLFSDSFGHGGRLAIREGALLWLAVIYDVDLREYEYDTGIGYDLKGLVQRIVDEDPYCR